VAAEDATSTTSLVTETIRRCRPSSKKDAVDLVLRRLVEPRLSRHLTA
jgi:Arc/MetJ family transcription regulator